MRVRGPRSLSQAVRWLLNPGRTGAPSFSYRGVQLCRRHIDLRHPREWSDVARESRYKGKIIHLGRVFCIKVEKRSGIDTADKLAGTIPRIWKYRVVYQGNNVVTADC